jgi:hypothetical protein
LPKTNFLFWNLNRKPLPEMVAELAAERSVDVVMLAESSNETATLLALNRSRTEFHVSRSSSEAVTIFTRFSGEFLKPTFESDRITIRRLELPARLELLLAAVHLPSKLHLSPDSQSLECMELARQITVQEDRVGHRRTILIGDFNMNPFEPGMVAAGGLNSVMSRNLVERGARKVQGRDYRFFYNPMWSHLGDAKSHTAGSYFYDSGEHMNYYWNMFDQILLRPELAQRFDPAGLSVVKSVGARSLVRTNGRPNSAAFSDRSAVRRRPQS